MIFFTSRVTQDSLTKIKSRGKEGEALKWHEARLRGGRGLQVGDGITLGRGY